MNQKTADPKAQDLAQRLVAYEAATLASSKAIVPAALQVSEKLRRPLSTLVGVSGFRAVLGRALTLTTAQFPSLIVVQVKADGSLDGLAELHDGNAAEEGVMLVAHLIGLLVTFIGEDLTFRLVLGLWPDLPIPGREFQTGSEHVPTN